jgi:hypothetical protein
MKSVENMTDNEQKLCTEMQLDGHCSSIDCDVCMHVMRLLTTMFKLMSKGI